MKATRRNFLIGAGVVGGGLVVGFSMRGGPGAPPLKAVEGAYGPNAFLQIGADNVMRFYCPRDEMGQGVTTGLATLVGEELDVDPAKLLIELAGVHPDYANPAMRVQGTGGSTSMRAHYLPLRQVGADTRQAIVRAAAEQLGVPAAELATDDGHVLARGERHPYGDFVETARTRALPENTPLKPAAEFKYIGQEAPRIDSVGKATGTTVFGIDVDLPDMHHAVVRRPPVAGGTVASFDAGEARGMPGVVAVVEVSTGVAVVAERHWQAKKAAETLRVQWSPSSMASVNSRQIEADYRRALAREDGDSAQREGDPEAALAASHAVAAEYWAPYLAHAPMEPMNAVVRVGNGEAEVWTGTQALGAARGLVARVAGLDAERVRAHNTYLGGAFGRRMTMTHVVEATEAAVATGKPVQVLWSREDDIRSGVFRPASLMRIEAGIAPDGAIAAWRAKRVGGNILPETVRSVMPALLPGVAEGVFDWAADRADGVFASWMVDATSVEGLAGDYDFPHREVRHVTKDHGLPLTFWRSVGHSFTAFAKESMIDELAAAEGLDPVDVRLRNTANNPRMREVVRIAGERMRRMHVPAGRALGLAAHASFGTNVAEVAEVSVEGGAIRVHNVLCVVDCGRAINPDVVRAQMEGSVMYGLTAALHGNLEVENGAIRESNFHDYPILRMNEAPAVEVILVDSTEHPSGVGEPGLPPIAPAVANAVYAATGQRLRSLPLRVASA